MFDGLLVIELATVLAGPAVGQFFAELGARVIKIEPPDGDVTRTWRLPSENATDLQTAYFCATNWGKESICLNLKTPDDYQLARKMIDKADVVIVNYKPGDAEKLALTYELLSTTNPGLIYGQITGYGAGNPRTGYDAVIQAEAGFMYLNREPEAPPTKMPVALMDLLAAHQLKEGLLVALYQRARTGKGALVEVSLFEAAVASLANQATAWLVRRWVPQPMGSAHPAIVPYGTVFQTADNHDIILAVGSDRQFEQLCQLLECAFIAADPRFQTNTQRVQNKNQLIPLLAAAIKKQTADQLLHACLQVGIPAGAVNTIPSVFELPETRPLLLTDTAQTLSGLRTAAFRINQQLPHNPNLLPPPQLNEHEAIIRAAFS